MNKPKISESQFQKQVIQLAQLRGWRVAHFRAARVTIKGKQTYRTPVAADGKGFPDLVLARDGVVMFRECKTDDGELTREQQDWLLSTKGKVWRPKHWLSIEMELL